MTSISQLPAEEIHRLMTTKGAMRLEDIPLVHLRAAELLKQMAEVEKDAKRYRWLRQQTWRSGGLCVTDAKNIRLGSDVPSDERLDDVIDKASA